MTTLKKIISDLDDVKRDLQETINQFKDINDTFEIDQEIEGDESLNAFLKAWHDFKNELETADINNNTHIITYDNLQDMTAQESGIVIYDNDTVIICNWAGSDKGIPILSPLGQPIKWNFDEWEITTTKYLDAIIDYLDGMELIYDKNDDIENLAQERTGGILYILSNKIQIIAPDGWN